MPLLSRARPSPLTHYNSAANSLLCGEREADLPLHRQNNQPTLRQDIALFFENRPEPDFIDHTPPDHGRIETRKIWTTTALNGLPGFPQAVNLIC